MTPTSGYRWTKKRPTVEGYWWRRPLGCIAGGIIRVTRDDVDGRLWGGARRIESFEGGEWAGPLPEPREP